MPYLVLYLVTALVFLVGDLVWIGGFMKPLFEAEIPQLLAVEIGMAPAVGFYLAYNAGVLYFASARGLSGKPVREVAVDGAVLGFIAYGTYAATNLAVVEGWSPVVSLADIVWGSLATPTFAVVGLLITRKLLSRTAAA